MTDKERKPEYFLISGSSVYHEMHCGCETKCGLRVMEEEGEKTRKTKPRRLRLCKKCKWENERAAFYKENHK